MTIDLSKIKPGDEVTVTARVNEVGIASGTRGLVQLRFVTPEYADWAANVPLSAIVSHTPKAFAVGDRVVGGPGSGAAGRLGEIIAAQGEYLWVLFANTPDPRTLSAEWLERQP